MKKFKYYTSATITLPDGSTEKYQSQLYETGVYIIFNNDTPLQSIEEPSGMQKMCKKLQKDLETGKITSINWGREITVAQVDGFWKEVQ